MMKDIIVMLLAAFVTIGVFILLGYTPKVFYAYLAMIVIMYFYTTTEKIEDTLFKVIIFISFTLILGWWYKKAKQYSEGFYVTPLRRISSRMTARQCQDYCQNTRYCKYSQVPLGSSRSGRKTYCWNSYGRNQRIWGSRNRGGDTWRNKLYRDPPPPPPPAPPVGQFYLRYNSSWPNCSNIQCGSGTLLSFKQKCTANRRCDGFSWTKNRNWNSARGSGCLKYSCKPYQERRNGFGRGGYGYWLKGKKCDETLRGWRQNGYRGCQNRTISGRVCQKWTSQSPHGHSNTPGRRRGKGLGNHNYCRNPDGESGIWCYTTDRRKRWERCNPK